ncbi:MAG TPA: threonine--tRNA ligase [Bacilli bacterium]|nr:threonine--tRNA ligase [Bacilli bacterium]
MIKVTFLDGSIREFEQGIKVEEIAKALSVSLAKRVVSAIVNGVFTELNASVNSDITLELITKEDKRAIDVFNHSCAHLLANAVKAIYPHALFGVGPAIEEGFYYDIDLKDIKLTDEDLVTIEKMMVKLANQNLEIVRSELSKKDALELFAHDKYKQELINDLPETEIISIYRQGDFVDLCRGGHLSNTKWLKHFKLLSISGAYWRGDSKREQLQRIYGTCFATEEELKSHLVLLEERKKRDHRKLGKELELFMISEFGPGFPFWLPKGMILRRALENYWYDVHTKEGYQFIQTPIMLDKELWEISGHWFNYRENMYTSEIDKHEFAIKPMNCPGGMLVYKNSLHSYRDLPLRVGELGLVHRHEASGALAGLFRVRNFTQDDAHLYMREDQMIEEVGKLIQLFDQVYSVFDLSYHIELSTRPEEKYIGRIETWDKAEKALAEACEKVGRKYIVNPGDGAFYGPKLDFKLRDSMNRIWQCGTIQLDMNLPERFDLTYIDATGEKKRPIMLHRALFGSIERFIGILIEHYAGAFPLWLAPVQMIVIPVNAEAHGEFAKKINDQLLQLGYRVSLDSRDEKMGYKIRESQTKKVPYSLVIGDQEVQNNQITYRAYGENASHTVSFDAFVELLKDRIERKK